jgi:hypothetical protein
MGLLDGASASSELLKGLLAQHINIASPPLVQPPMSGPGGGPGGPSGDLSGNLLSLLMGKSGGMPQLPGVQAIGPAGPLNGPTAQPMPDVGHPPQPSMMERVKRNISGLLEQNAPQGYEGLLSPDEIAGAKPSFMSRLASITPGAPSPGEQYQANLNNIVKMHGLATQVAERKQIMDARQQMATLFPPKPNETLDEMRQRFGAMGAFALAHGDDETVKDISSTMRAILAAPRQTPLREPFQVKGIVSDGSFNPANKGKTVDQLIDPDTRKVVAEMQAGAAPMSPEAQAFREASLALSRQNADALASQRDIANQAREDSRLAGVASHFQAGQKTLLDTAPKYANFLNIVKEAKAGTPAALQSTLYNFVSNTDLNPQMRQGILNKLEQIAPGITNKVGYEFEKAIAGKLRPADIADMERIVRGAHKTVRDLYEQRYNAMVKANPGIERYLAAIAPEAAFDVPNDAGQIPTGRTKADLFRSP